MAVFRREPTIPSNVFPNGLPVTPYQITYAAGSIQSTPMTYPVGTIIPAGVKLPQTVQITPAAALNPSFFTAGFSELRHQWRPRRCGGQQHRDRDRRCRSTGSRRTAMRQRTGSDPSSALTLWTPPLFTADLVKAAVTQRGGAASSRCARSIESGPVPRRRRRDRGGRWWCLDQRRSGPEHHARRLRPDQRVRQPHRAWRQHHFGQ